MDSYPPLEPNCATIVDNPKTTLQDAAWALLGLNPHAIKREAEIQKRPACDHTKEERAFLEVLAKRDPMRAPLNDQHATLVQNVPWTGDVLAFVRGAYRRHMVVDGPLIDHLESCGHTIRQPELEALRDHTIFAFAAGREIFDSEDKNHVLAALLDLNPEYLVQCIVRRMRGDEKVSILKNIDTLEGGSVQKIWADREYTCFIGNKFCEIGFFPYHAFLDFYKKISNEIWNNDPQEYIEHLHNAGYIFADVGYANIERMGLARPTYAPDGWATQFYAHWAKEDLWTLRQAVALFTGKDPRGKDHRAFCDISQNTHLVYEGGMGFRYYNSVTKSFFDLEARLTKHATSSAIEALDVPGSTEPHFRAADIVRWLCENTEQRPPEPLLRLLLPDKLDDRAPPPTQKLPKKRRQTIVREIAISAWKEHEQQHACEPLKEHLLDCIMKDPRMANEIRPTIERHDLRMPTIRKAAQQKGAAPNRP
jgi:hypothetical protein